MKSKLQKKMVEDMQLHGYAKRTQTTYSRAVRQLENYEPSLCCAQHKNGYVA